METKTFKLEKSGYTAELKSYLSTKASRGYRKIVTSTSVLKVGDTKKGEKATVEMGEMKLETIMEAQEYVLEHILVTLLDKEGNTKTFIDLMELPSVDVDPLFEYADKLINGGSLSATEKKDGLVAVSSSKKESAVSTPKT